MNTKMNHKDDPWISTSHLLHLLAHLDVISYRAFNGNDINQFLRRKKTYASVSKVYTIREYL